MRCPACKAWLPSDWPIGAQFQCKACGAVLETLPSIPETWTNLKGETETEEEDVDYDHGGRLCVIPEVAIKIVVVDYPLKKPPKDKFKTNRRAVGETWARRVWKDAEGKEFIEIGFLGRIYLPDERIRSFVEDEE